MHLKEYSYISCNKNWKHSLLTIENCVKYSCIMEYSYNKMTTVDIVIKIDTHNILFGN